MENDLKAIKVENGYFITLLELAVHNFLKYIACEHVIFFLFKNVQNQLLRNLWDDRLRSFPNKRQRETELLFDDNLFL